MHDCCILLPERMFYNCEGALKKGFSACCTCRIIKQSHNQAQEQSHATHSAFFRPAYWD